MFTAIIRILFLIFLVPSYGIMGYLWGVLVSELCGTILNVRKVKKICHLSYSVVEFIFKPMLLTFISISFAVSVKYLVDGINVFPNILTLSICAFLSCSIFILFVFNDSKK